MQKFKRNQPSTWIGLALACSVIAACGGGDEPVGSDPTTPAPSPAPGGPAPTPPPANDGPTPAPVPPPAGENPVPAPPPVATGQASDCLPTDLMGTASTWEANAETVFSDGSPTQFSTTTITSTPGITSPIGSGTRLVTDAMSDDGNGNGFSGQLEFFIQLNGNFVEQFFGEFTSSGAVFNVESSFTDPSFDLALNESRTLPKTVKVLNFPPRTFDVTYTYLGQKVLQTAMGSFDTCLMSQKTTILTGNQPDETLQWFAVGTGFPLKTETIPASNASYTNEVTSAKINGTPLVGN